MMRLDLGGRNKDPLVVLCVGAHSDDIEIGCGGTLLYLSQIVPKLKLHWVVFSALGPRRGEAEKGAELFGAACERKVVLNEFRDGFMPYHGAKVKDCFEEMKAEVNPDLILTHWQKDAHQDHRLICELTWNTFRNHLILEYEIPKYDGDMGRPNLFVPLGAPLCARKLDFLHQAFQSQSSKAWFSRETFLGLMRIRGMECNSPSGYAEAFHVRKLTIGGIS